MNNANFRAVVSDLDGTLLNGQHILGEFSINILRKLADKGVDIILATGRSHVDVAYLLEKININNAVMITSNGARAQSLQGDLLFSDNLNPEIALEIMQLPFDQTKVCVNSYQGNDWFINIDVPQLRHFHQESGFMYQVIDFSKHHGKNTEKVFFLGREPKDLIDLEQHIKQHYGDKVNVTYSTPICLEVMNKNVSKAKALESVLADRDYGMQNCIAFGDGLNDVEMLTQVGKGCIMENADPRLKALSLGLEEIGHHADEAVANYLQQCFKLS